MTILSRVCAQFHDRHGVPVFRVTPAMLHTIQTDVPEAIRQDPLFALLVAEGSLEEVLTASQKKALEKDPVAGTDATGKRIQPEDDTAKKTGRGKAPAADAAH